MKKIAASLLFLFVIVSITSCKRNYEEFYFKGKVVDGQFCAATQMAYMIEVEYPEGIGDTITLNGVHYKNAVMGYRPPRLLKADETVYGVAYFYKDYAAYNCMFIFYDNLPEMFLLSVDEDPSVVGE